MILTPLKPVGQNCKAKKSARGCAIPAALQALLLTLVLFSPSPLRAETFLRPAKLLIDTVTAGDYEDFFAHTTPRLLSPSGRTAPPLARYRPVDGDDKAGIVEFSDDDERYQREYALAILSVPAASRPTYAQYMTVLTALSLANEKAHYDQHINGSLKDFYDTRKTGRIAASCGIYALQQHVSDIVMLDMALRLQDYFMRRQEPIGVNAVLVALERMSLRDIYRDFRIAAGLRDRLRMTDALTRLKKHRDALNLSGLTECTASGRVILPADIIARAVSPAIHYLLPPQQSSDPLRLND